MAQWIMKNSTAKAAVLFFGWVIIDKSKEVFKVKEQYCRFGWPPNVRRSFLAANPTI